MIRFSHLFNVFYPKTCVCCLRPLLDQETLICLHCRFDLPFVDNGDFTTNATTQIFQGRVAVKYGASLLYYHETGKTKQLIRELKYQNNQNVGVLLANWLGKALQEMEIAQEFDCIIPVPLHRKKLKKRGYNQLTEFGKYLSKILNTTYREDLLHRVSFTNTQTKKKRMDRFQNTNSKFLLSETQDLDHKHILLIDDVVTTGATLEACCRELQKAEGVKISLATMAITE